MLTSIRSSFRAKILIAFSLLSALVSILLSTLYISSEISEKRANLSANLKLVSQQLTESIRLPLYAENRIALQQTAESTLRLPEIKGVIIRAADDRVLIELRTADSPAPDALLTETTQVFSSPLTSSVEEALSGGTDSERSLIGSLRLERSTADLSQQIRQLVLYAACLALLSWLIVSAAFYLILRRFTTSFNLLMLGLKHMHDGDYDTRISITSSDEPGRAAQAVNDLAMMLQQRTAENLQLTGDLRDREQNLKRLLEALPVGVLWYDSSGRVEYINSFIRDCFGSDAEVSATIDNFFTAILPDPAYREQVIDILGQAGDDESPAPAEARITCLDGTIRHVIIRKTLEQTRTILLFVNITERELLQEQLIRTQKLESIGILAGGIAHNFNNALTGVMGFISLATRQLDPESKAAALLQRAEQATMRSAAMAKQLLTFAQGGAPHKKVLSPARLVDESVVMALNGSNVCHQLLIPEDLHSILGDEDQLSQVFNNLAINAVHAMPTGGTLTIRAENVVSEAGQTPSGKHSSYIVLSFTDTGHGIPAANLTRIFEPYFTTNPSHTGLGLASALSIMHKHGGRITVDSTVGIGTTFTLLLPSTADAPEPDEKKCRPLRNIHQGNISVLVMDDEQTIRDLALHSLEFLGYEATVCENGEQAVAAYRSAHDAGRPFMAAILDLTIPGGMGGLEASRLILAFDPTARLIVSSGYSLDPVMSDYKAYGFCATVAKPYQAETLGLELDLIHAQTAGDL